MNTAHSGCKPSSSVSSLIHTFSKSFGDCSCPYSSPPPPRNVYRPTPNHLHSYVPHAQTKVDIDLPGHTISIKQSQSIYPASPPQPRSEHPKDCTRTSLRFLPFRDTHIHLTIIRSALSMLCRFSVTTHVSVSYVNTLIWIHALQIYAI